MSQTQRVYFFGDKKADGRADMKNLLGGKGANLAEMTNLGLPVPPGFTISAEVCAEFTKSGEQIFKDIEKEVESHLKKVEDSLGVRFGDAENPLLVSVRSGARVSMPGMMDTILNLGLNEKTLQGLAKKTDNERFAWDSYRRFIQMYSDVVLGVSNSHFENEIEDLKEDQGYTNDTEIQASEWKSLTDRFKKVVLEQCGKRFPEDPKDQLWGAIKAVFESWNNPRAITYRKINGLADEWGTAVNVQAMVFGNMGEDSATGVAFTRDPSTGENRFYGEFLVNAQGEDVVAGIRTPHPLNELSRNEGDHEMRTLEELMPKAYKELEAIQKKLEAHYKDMQDLEFTIQNGELFMLQTRNGKRTAPAALRIAVEMEREGLIDKKTAVKRIEPKQLDQLLHPMIDPDAKKTILAKGLPASPGAAAGQVVFDSDTATQHKKDNKPVVLVRVETSPEDIAGMDAAEGILTSRGGMTSHAAVVARGMGKCCVAGCSEIKISYERKELMAGEKVIKEGDWISLDGTKGEVLEGKVPTKEPTGNEHFSELMTWADDFRKLKVRTNADTPEDSELARKFGAEGIGLCRTEHMFFEKERIGAVRRMILSEDKKDREQALEKILPMQREDFIGIFKAMKGLPVTIRLLDPPLHEFLPHTKEELKPLAESLGYREEDLSRKVDQLHEFNPMLGHRGCRLGITYPEIYRMQVRAILEAACELHKKDKQTVTPEIMVPLVSHWRELAIVRDHIEQEAALVQKEQGVDLQYQVGTMIELPRACLTADEVAERADFFSFGTNDLTQTTFGLSRDDAGRFLTGYVEDYGILEQDPFQSIDQSGVGSLVQTAVEKGRKTKKNLKIGICGEQGADPDSVSFCHKQELNYVSCSPFRVPIARLAAAHASLDET